MLKLKVSIVPVVPCRVGGAVENHLLGFSPLQTWKSAGFVPERAPSCRDRARWVHRAAPWPQVLMTSVPGGCSAGAHKSSSENENVIFLDL